MGFRVGGSIFQVPPAEIGLILSKLELFMKKTVVKDQKKIKTFAVIEILCPNSMNLSRRLNLPKTGSIERRLKS